MFENYEQGRENRNCLWCSKAGRNLWNMDSPWASFWGKCCFRPCTHVKNVTDIGWKSPEHGVEWVAARTMREWLFPNRPGPGLAGSMWSSSVYISQRADTPTASSLCQGQVLCLYWTEGSKTFSTHRTFLLVARLTEPFLHINIVYEDVLTNQSLQQRKRRYWEQNGALKSMWLAMHREALGTKLLNIEKQRIHPDNRTNRTEERLCGNKAGSSLTVAPEKESRCRRLESSELR